MNSRNMNSKLRNSSSRDFLSEQSASKVKAPKGISNILWHRIKNSINSRLPSAVKESQESQTKRKTTPVPEVIP